MKQEILGIRILKYSLILLSAAGLSAISYSCPPLSWLFREIARTVAITHYNWMTYHHSLFSWVASGIYLITISVGIVSPFVLVIIITIHLFKTEWLPKDDPYLIKPLNQWFNFCLFTFVITLLGVVLEGLGIV